MDGAAASPVRAATSPVKAAARVARALPGVNIPTAGSLLGSGSLLGKDLGRVGAAVSPVRAHPHILVDGPRLTGESILNGAAARSMMTYLAIGLPNLRVEIGGVHQKKVFAMLLVLLMTAVKKFASSRRKSISSPVNLAITDLRSAEIQSIQLLVWRLERLISSLN